MNPTYRAGSEARKADRDYCCNPHSRKVPAFYQWCAGWNDEDMRVNAMRYFVNDVTRLVRTDDTGKYEPTGDWREVTSVEWDAFRVETFNIKRSKRK